MHKITFFGLFAEVEKPIEAASLDLQSLDDFPSQIAPSSPDAYPIYTAAPAAWGASSFANALQRAPQTVPRRVDVPRQRTVSEASTCWMSVQFMCLILSMISVDADTQISFCFLMAVFS